MIELTYTTDVVRICHQLIIPFIKNTIKMSLSKHLQIIVISITHKVL